MSDWNTCWVPADQRFESVPDGKIDILCDPSTVTLPRREMVDFSLPTFLDGAMARLYRSGRINVILAKTFGRVRPDDMLKAKIVINSLPDK